MSKQATMDRDKPRMFTNENTIFLVNCLNAKRKLEMIIT